MTCKYFKSLGKIDFVSKNLEILKLHLYQSPATPAGSVSAAMSTHLPWMGPVQLLQFPHQEEQAEAEHRDQSLEGPQFLLLQWFDPLQDHGPGASGGQKGHCRCGAYKVQIRSAEASHLINTDRHQQECTGHAQRQLARDLQEQVPPHLRMAASTDAAPSCAAEAKHGEEEAHTPIQNA